jgi:hypothetical protein
VLATVHGEVAVLLAVADIAVVLAVEVALADEGAVVRTASLPGRLAALPGSRVHEAVPALGLPALALQADAPGIISTHEAVLGRGPVLAGVGREIARLLTVAGIAVRAVAVVGASRIIDGVVGGIPGRVRCIIDDLHGVETRILVADVFLPLTHHSLARDQDEAR